jgi:hypothetical protein
MVNSALFGMTSTFSGVNFSLGKSCLWWVFCVFVYFAHSILMTIYVYIDIYIYVCYRTSPANKTNIGQIFFDNILIVYCLAPHCCCWAPYFFQVEAICLMLQWTKLPAWNWLTPHFFIFFQTSIAISAGKRIFHAQITILKHVEAMLKPHLFGAHQEPSVGITDGAVQVHDFEVPTRCRWWVKSSDDSDG